MNDGVQRWRKNDLTVADDNLAARAKQCKAALDEVDDVAFGSKTGLLNTGMGNLSLHLKTQLLTENCNVSTRNLPLAVRRLTAAVAAADNVVCDAYLHAAVKGACVSTKSTATDETFEEDDDEPAVDEDDEDDEDDDGGAPTTAPTTAATATTTAATTATTALNAAQTAVVQKVIDVVRSIVNALDAKAYGLASAIADSNSRSALIAVLGAHAASFAPSSCREFPYAPVPRPKFGATSVPFVIVNKDDLYPKTMTCNTMCGFLFCSLLIDSSLCVCVCGSFRNASKVVWRGANGQANVASCPERNRTVRIVVVVQCFDEVYI